MSILNLPSDGLPSVLLVLYRTVCLLGPQKREALINLVSPPELGKDRRQAQQTLNRWLDLCFFQEQDGEISLPDEYKPLKKDDYSLLETLKKQARRRLFSVENNANILESAEKSADFTFAISWILAQDVYNFPGGSHKDMELIESAQLGGPRAFTNDTRWGGFKNWAIFLDFGWNSVGGNLTLDPGRVVAVECDGIFGKEKQLRIDRFINRCSELLPIIDNGVYRKQVEREIREEAIHRVLPHQVSPSLSRALLYLEQSGRLKLESRDDSKVKLEFLGSNFKPLNRSLVTDVVRGGGG